MRCYPGSPQPSSPGNQLETRKSVDGEPSHIPALIKANRIEASYFLEYVAKYG